MSQHEMERKQISQCELFEKKFDLYDQSQQTRYDEEEENYSSALQQTSEQNGGDVEVNQSSQIHGKTQEKVTKKYFNAHLEEQITKHGFLSVSKLYDNEICSKYQLKEHEMFNKNYQIKYKQANLKNRIKQLSIIKKLCGLKNQKKFKEIKETIEKQDLECNHINQIKINFYKCQCDYVTITKNLFLKHLKGKSHRILLCIQTQRQRKIQQKLYKTLSKDEDLKVFNPFWLYKSFQIIFVEAEIHYSLNSINNSLLLSTQIEKIRQDVIQSYFSLPLVSAEMKLKQNFHKIYLNLHSFHNGNQRVCHKCLQIDDHAILFALAVLKLIEKRKKCYDYEDEGDKFQAFQKIMNLILMQFTGIITKQQLSKNYPTSKCSVYESLTKITFGLFKKYVRSFQYIELTKKYDIQQN